MNMRMPALRCALMVSVSVLGLTHAAAAADDNALEKRVMEQQQQISAQQAEIDALKQQVKDLITIVGNRVSKVEVQAETATKPAPHAIQTSSNKLGLETADGKFSISPTGVVQVDFGGYVSLKPDNRFVGAQRLSGGVNARRARIGVSGKLFGDWSYKFIYDGGNSQDTTAAGINAAQISYNGWKGVIVDLPGYSATPFTMDQATSANDLLFLERSTPTNIAIGFNAGDSRTNTGVRVFGDRYWFGAYFTGPASGDSHTGVLERFGAFQRAAFQVVAEKDYSVHLGVGIDELLQVPDTGVGTAKAITLSDRAEIRIDPTTFVNTGNVGTIANPVTGARVINVETAAQYENFLIQGEYFNYNISRRGLADANFNGGYVQTGWVLTGERHGYDKAQAAYTGITPAKPFSINGNGYGAFELAARVSYIDLTDNFIVGRTLASQPAAVNGGKQTSYTVGLNWYANSLLRFTANYIHTDFKKANGTAVTGAALGAPVGAKLDSVGVRAQIQY